MGFYLFEVIFFRSIGLARSCVFDREFLGLYEVCCMYN